jgi:hypothetical protein
MSCSGTTAPSATEGIDSPLLERCGVDEVGCIEMERDAISNALDMGQGDVSDVTLWIKCLVVSLPV